MCVCEIEYLAQISQNKGTKVFQFEKCKAVGAENSRVSAGFQGCTDLIGSVRSGIVVNLGLLPDESHYTSGCGICIEWS